MQQSASLFGQQAQQEPDADDSQSQQASQGQGGSFVQVAAQTMRQVQDLAQMNPDFAPYADKILQMFQQGLVDTANKSPQQSQPQAQQPMSNNAAMSSPQYA